MHSPGMPNYMIFYIFFVAVDQGLDRLLCISCCCILYYCKTPLRGAHAFTFNGHSIIAPGGPIMPDNFLVITDQALSSCYQGITVKLGVS